MVKILIAGDFVPKDRVLKLIEEEKYSDIFSDILPYTDQCDYSILNLESPVVESSTATPIEKCGPHLKCTSKAIKAMKYAGFNMATLANNHFYDYGEEGVRDTLDACYREGVDIVGGGMNINEASRVFYKEINDVKFAFINCCEHEFSIASDLSAGSNPLDPIKQYYAIIEAKAKADKIIVIVHGGHEHYQLPSPRMQATYRFFVDLGADVVINHHQHCYSGYEVYKDKPIFYGLGNFCFDRETKRNSPWNQGYMVILNISSDISFDVLPYYQGNEIPGISLCSESDILIFNKTINNLNSIISNVTKLTAEHELYMSSTSVGYISTLEPYTNRYVKYLYSRRLLPSFISDTKRLSLLNFIICESHRERLLNSLRSKIH